MKKLFFFLAALTLSFTAHAKVVECSPNTNAISWWLTQGDTLVLADGLYEEAYSIDFDKPGVCVKAAEGAKPVIAFTGEWTAFEVSALTTFDGITFDGRNVANYIIAALDSTTLTTDLIIKNCEFKNWTHWAISHQYEKNVSVNSIVIDNCLFHDGKNSAVYFSANAPEGKHACQDLKITNSTFYNIGDATSAYTTVYSLSNANATSAQKVTVDYCTFYNCQAKNTDHAAVRVTCAATISNTIIAVPESQSTYRAIHASDGSNAQAINCLTYNYEKDNGGIRSGATQTNCQLNVDPKFVGADNGNFALAEDSPALTAGTDGKAIGDPRWNAPATPEIEWMEMDVELSNLQLDTTHMAELSIMGLVASNDMEGIEAQLFLNDYTGEDKEYVLNEASYLTYGGLEVTFIEGTMTKEGNVFTGVLKGTVTDEEFGEDPLYVAFNLTLYKKEAVVVEVTDAVITVEELSDGMGGTYESITVSAKWNESTLLIEGIEKEYEGFAQIKETLIVDGVEDWYIWMCQNAVVTTVDNILTVTGEFSNNFTGDVYAVSISGALPVVEEPEVELPEPTYTENKLNPYAFGLESKLSADNATLNVTYRLNNSNATSVNVVVYNGEEVVATVAGTTTIGKNTVAVPTAGLPGGVELTWGIEVKGTSVEAPTQETKMYNLYCPHGLAIDKNPESENFGRILVAEGMQAVPATNYLSSGKGAGLYVFNPSFASDSVVYKGGNDFTRVWASNGYQPWRVKISEDGRIFVSSLDLNGVVVWEVSKDLQTWTPVIAGTQGENGNILDAEGNFVAGMNVSMDVVGSGENLKLLLYSCTTSASAFSQSAFRLDEYALGTATTWTGIPKNILTGGKYALVHTNAEWIYDGEGGYWFGGSRAGNAGQPNLAHINAEGVEDYRNEDASLYGGDGVLVHNGMLFKGKARTSGTVGNFGVWTIGKDAEGNTTLTEKWSVVADGIGRNLNEFAVDYAENLYIVGNSNEKIIAYALPYSGTVETPAAAKYAFQLPEPLKMAGTVKRAIQNGNAVVVLTHEADGTAHIYNVVNGEVVAEISQEGVIARDPENAGDLLAISDIALTEDGKLVAINYMITQSDDTRVDAGYKRGETRVYLWNDLAGDPSILFTSKMSSNWFRSKQGLTMAVKGTSDNMEIFTTGIHATSAWARVSSYRVIDGVYVEPEVNHNDHYFFYDVNDAIALETTVGTQYELNASPLGKMNWILDANLINPVEIVEPETNNVEIASCVALTEDLGKKFNGASYVTVGEQVLMVAPFATPEGKLIGVEILDITNGLAGALYVDMLYLDDAVEAAAATAVKVVEGEDANSLVITLVADATLYTLEAELAGEPEYQVYEDEITNLVIDLDNFVLIGGPSSAFQVDVYLGLGEYNRNDDTYQLLPESSVALMGTDATFVEGYAYEVDAFTPSAKAVVRCVWNSMNIELHLTMSAAPLVATKVVVENATVEVEKYLLFGDMYDYALKMTGEWVNPEDGLTYPVLVEVPVYYPEATEPSEITSTVTVGGWEDDDPWLGFGEGTLTVTTVGNTVTATGIVQNPMAGVAIDITISGKLAADEPTKYTVTATVNPAEAGTVTGAGEYEEGAEVTLTATAAEGYEFVNWTVAGAEVATTAEYTFTVTADVEVVANFVAASAVDNIPVTVKAMKVVKNGQLVIIKGDAEYNAQGAVIK